MRKTLHKERLIARVAHQQFRLIHLHQARACGVNDSSISLRVAEGLWKRVLPRVYLVGSGPLTCKQRLMAAVLWAGEGAAVSHAAAAKLHDLDGIDVEVVEISSSRQLRPPVPWIVAHRTRLKSYECTTIDDLPVTDVHRTLIDLGSSVSAAIVESALECACRRGLTTPSYLCRRLASAGGSGRRGSGVLRRLLDERDPSEAPTESDAETLMWKIGRRYRLPPMARQYVVVDAGVRCDSLIRTY